MPSREPWQPVRMQRVALVGPVQDLRALLVEVSDAGCVDLDEPLPSREQLQGEARRRLQRLGAPSSATPRLSRDLPDLDALEAAGRVDLLLGEAALEHRAQQALVRGPVAASAGWAPSAELPGLASRLARVGAAVVPLPAPEGQDVPSLLIRSAGEDPSVALVETYAVVPYADVDPRRLAAAAYVLMFGMMFADAGQGLLLVLAGLALRSGRPHRLSRYRSGWRFLVAAGAVSAFFGLLYGEFFGPTGAVPVLWLDPLEHPMQLLSLAVAVGAVLLAAGYALGTVNRRREGGWRLALYAPTGVAGATLFLALGLVATAWYVGDPWLSALAVLTALTGMVLSFIGLLAESGGGGTGVAQAVVELFDVLVRLGSNLLSFARLAAFGLTHAALGMVVWDGSTALWSRGGLAAAAAVPTFLLGNGLTFGLEALVAGVQALRLEYYELFSRVFAGEGRPFRPWHVPVDTEEAAP